MSARIIVTLILEYAGNDTAEYDQAMECARLCVDEAGDNVKALYETVRVVGVQVSG